MDWIDFRSLPLGTNLLLFAAAAGAIWIAGSHLARYAEAISERTGVGRAFIGALLLGGITSLPGLATTITASAIGNAALAVNNLFGGVAMQVALLAVADALVPGRPLSSASAKPNLMLQGALLVLALAVAAAGILVGDVAILPFGAWTLVLFLLGLAGFYLIQRYEAHPRWQPVLGEAERRRERKRREKGKQPRTPAYRLPTRRLVLYTAATAAAILAAGFALALSGDALAAQTGLGSSFVGATLVAFSASLPALSTTLAAARLGRFELAFSNVYGANLLDVAMLFVADLAYAGPPVLNTVGRFSLLGAILGIVVTTIYLVGLVERRNRTIWRLGPDSVVVLAVYVAGLAALYTLRASP